MPFSVRVHPAPFSPTPNRHAGIKLKTKGGGPGTSRNGQSLWTLVGGEHERGSGEGEGEGLSGEVLTGD